MNYNKYFKNYSESINKLLLDVNPDLIDKSVQLINKAKNNKNKIYIIGNGGSSSIASHVSVDFTKIAKIPTLTFNNSNLITCFANDYGYENWVTEALKSYYNQGDLIILISSSGKSMNILNAANYCKENTIDLITFSGFKKDNPLSSLGNIKLLY